jgi:protein phosphatase
MIIRLSQPLSFSQQGGRDYQEDARFPDSDFPSPKQRFFIVCDGVGGSEHGELASNTVCRAFARKMPALNEQDDFSNDDFSHVLDFAYDQLDKTACKTKGDMATTLTFICFHACGCTMAHIGDSRIYQIRPMQGIIYRSDDHSLVNSMVHNGVISPEQALEHPQSNVIIRCMEPVEERQNRSQATVIRTRDIESGDYFLLCSDGVLENIDDDLLTDILVGSDASDNEKMRQIRDICKESNDNNTAVLLRISEVLKSESEMEKPDNFPNDDANEPSTRRFERHKHESSEIESVQSPKNDGFLSKLKRLFTGE